jgi:hypothetical protein
MTNVSSLSPSASICSSITDIKEDKAKEACEGSVKELEPPLSKTKSMVGAEGFSSLA